MRPLRRGQQRHRVRAFDPAQLSIAAGTDTWRQALPELPAIPEPFAEFFAKRALAADFNTKGASFAYAAQLLNR